jgi:hypothetical protein
MTGEIRRRPYETEQQFEDRLLAAVSQVLQSFGPGQYPLAHETDEQHLRRVSTRVMEELKRRGEPSTVVRDDAVESASEEFDKLKTVDEATQIVAKYSSQLIRNIAPNALLLVGKRVGLTGNTRWFEEDDIPYLLFPDGVEWTSPDGGGTFVPDASTPIDYLVVGENGFDTEWIDICVASNPLNIHVFPQEGLLDLLLNGSDWWTEGVFFLNEFLKTHPGLQYVASLENFKWPSIEATESTSLDPNSEGFASITELRKVGYQITGRSRSARWATLSNVAVPTLGLQEVAETIGMLVRTRKAQRGGRRKYAHAIAEWEHDLDRLRQEYYERSIHGFRWPSVEP